MQHKNEYIWALAGRFLPLVIYLGTTMVLARFLSPDDFGKIGVLSMFFVVANTLMDAGLGGSLVKEKKLEEIDCSTIFVFNITISVILYLLLFLFAGAIENYFDVEGLKAVTQIICLVFVINAWGLVPRALLTRELQFRTISIINIVGVFVAALVSIVLAMFKCGVYALVAYQLANALITVILSLKASNNKISFRFSFDSLKRLFPFGIFTTLTTTIDTIYENLITFLFGKYLNLQQAGYLYQAKRLEEVPSQSLAQTISSVSFPVLTKIRNESDSFAAECINTFKTVLLLALPILFTMSLFSDVIIRIVYGGQWLSSAPYLSLLCFAAVFLIAETLNRTFIKATTHVDNLFYYTLIKRILGICVIFCFLFADPSYAIIGYIVSTFIGFILNMILLSRVSSVSVVEQIKCFVIVLLPNIIYYLLVIFLESFIHTIVIQIIFAVVLLIIYYFAVLRLYGLNTQEWLRKKTISAE